MNTVERIKAMCKERKIAISRLEKECGFANGYIGQLKKGSMPDDRLLTVADFFGVSVDYLLTGEIKKPTTEYGDGLSERKRKFIADVYDMTDEQVELLQRLVDQIKGRA